MAKNWKKKNRKPSQTVAINSRALQDIRNLRTCIQEIVQLEDALCVCIDAYKDRNMTDPSCQAHDWIDAIDEVIRTHRLRLDDIRKSNVYFIQAEQSLRIKIGIAENPEKRLKDLQVGSPEKLSLIGIVYGAGREEERRLHNVFHYAQTHGEWFEPTIRLVDWIQQYATIPTP